jgi:hypothetical protein
VTIWSLNLRATKFGVFISRRYCITEAHTRVTSLVTEESQKVCFTFHSDWNLDTVIFSWFRVHQVLYVMYTNIAWPHFVVELLSIGTVDMLSWLSAVLIVFHIYSL